MKNKVFKRGMAFLLAFIMAFVPVGNVPQGMIVMAAEQVNITSLQVGDKVPYGTTVYIDDNSWDEDGGYDFTVTYIGNVYNELLVSGSSVTLDSALGDGSLTEAMEFELAKYDTEEGFIVFDASEVSVDYQVIVDNAAAAVETMLDSVTFTNNYRTELTNCVSTELGKVTQATMAGSFEYSNEVQATTEASGGFDVQITVYAEEDISSTAVINKSFVIPKLEKSAEDKVAEFKAAITAAMASFVAEGTAEEIKAAAEAVVAEVFTNTGYTADDLTVTVTVENYVASTTAAAGSADVKIDIVSVADSTKSDSCSIECSIAQLEVVATEVSTWAGLTTALSEGGYIKMTGNITASESEYNHTVPAGVTAVLDLNGYTLDRGKAGTTTGYANFSINIAAGAELTVKDTSAEQTGKITGGGYASDNATAVNVGGTFNLESGSISGNGSDNSWRGAAVYVKTGAVFNMTGGTISDNTSNYGSAILSFGTVNITGGKITGNNSTTYDTAVAVVNFNRGPFSVGGTAYIYDNINVLTGNQANMGVSEGPIKLITENPLTDGAKIGISRGQSGYFTSCVAVTDGADYIDYFVADAPDTKIGLGSASLDPTQLYLASSSNTEVIKPFKAQDFVAFGDMLKAKIEAYVPGLSESEVKADIDAIVAEVYSITGYSKDVIATEVTVSNFVEPTTEGDGGVTVSYTSVAVSNPEFGEVTATVNLVIPQIHATEVSTWAGLKTALGNGGYIKMTGNITANEDEYYHTVPAGVTAVLDLNGYTLDRGKAGITTGYSNYSIHIESGAELTVKDSSTAQTGKITGGGIGSDTATAVLVNGTFNLQSGSITGNGTEDSWRGAAVYVKKNAVFNMTGGTISDNMGSCGCAVLSFGRVNITGGKITDNIPTLYDSATAAYNFGYDDFIVGGTAYIYNNINLLTGSQANMDLNGYKLNISAEVPLTEGAKIGVAKGYSLPCVIADNGAEYADYFVADATDTRLGIKADDTKLYLVEISDTSYLDPNPIIISALDFTLKDNEDGTYTISNLGTSRDGASWKMVEINVDEYKELYENDIWPYESDDEFYEEQRCLYLSAIGELIGRDMNDEDVAFIPRDMTVTVIPDNQEYTFTPTGRIVLVLECNDVSFEMYGSAAYKYSKVGMACIDAEGGDANNIFGKEMYAFDYSFVDSSLEEQIIVKSTRMGYILPGEDVVVTLKPALGMLFTSAPTMSAVNGTVGKGTADANGNYQFKITNVTGDLTLEIDASVEVAKIGALDAEISLNEDGTYKISGLTDSGYNYYCLAFDSQEMYEDFIANVNDSEIDELLTGVYGAVPPASEREAYIKNYVRKMFMAEGTYLYGAPQEAMEADVLPLDVKSVDSLVLEGEVIVLFKTKPFETDEIVTELYMSELPTGSEVKSNILKDYYSVMLNQDGLINAEAYADNPVLVDNANEKVTITVRPDAYSYFEAAPTVTVNTLQLSSEDEITQPLLTVSEGVLQKDGSYVYELSNYTGANGNLEETMVEVIIAGTAKVMIIQAQDFNITGNEDGTYTVTNLGDAGEGYHWRYFAVGSIPEDEELSEDEIAQMKEALREAAIELVSAFIGQNVSEDYMIPLGDGELSTGKLENNVDNIITADGIMIIVGRCADELYEGTNEEYYVLTSIGTAMMPEALKSSSGINTEKLYSFDDEKCEFELTNADIEVDRYKYIEEDDVVTLTIVPVDGYRFYSAPVVTAKGAVVRSTIKNDDGTYSVELTDFTDNVSISVQAEALDPATVKYLVKVLCEGNGTAEADVTEAAEGTVVTLTATPEEGFLFVGWEVNGDVTVVDNQFTMPAGDVEITAVFKVADPLVAFVERMYTVALNRDYDEEGRDIWVGTLREESRDGAGLAAEFVLGEEFKLRNLSNEEFVKVLYRTFFDREADQGGFELWLLHLDLGYSREFVLSKFVDSTEFMMVCDSYEIQRGVMLEDGTPVNVGLTKFVLRLYNTVLGRKADSDGLYTWVTALVFKAAAAQDVATGFFNSEEYNLKETDTETFVKDLYRVFMDREADESGFAFWVGCIDQSGMTRDEAIAHFAASEEFKMIAAGYGLE